MKIAILGATGRTGLHLVRIAMAAGHDVTAVLRDPGKLGELRPTRTFIADVRSPRELEPALAGVDAVVGCVGPTGRDSQRIQVDSIQACLDAIATVGVSRVVTISASGPFIDGDDPLTRYLAKPILWRLLRESFDDLRNMEAVLRASDTDWTIVRPPQLTDRAARGRYRSRRDGNVRWGFQITRADLAQALLGALLDDTTIHQTISVAN
jgi:putative NADH-flavin reductase